MSDSLNATVIVSVSVFTISAKPDAEPLEELEPEPARLPAVVEPEDPDELLEEDELEEEELPDPPLDTESPGVRLESEAIVPLTGA
jgi:hypothetical protein